MNWNQHPDKRLWLSFIEGKLTEHRIIELELHLENCPQCCELVRQFDHNDKLTQAIRSAHRTDESTAMDGTAHETNALDPKLPGSETGDDGNSAGQDTFGRFQLIRKLGQGGFGIVWLAVDPHLDRQISLKVPSAGSLITRDQKNRFLREATATAGLRHTSIVKVFDAGEINGVCFITSEFCTGSDLQHWLEDSLPSPRLAAIIMVPICNAVAHAHDHGILHRDLKPSNILLQPVSGDDSGLPNVSGFAFEPKVADFGLAKILYDGQDDTATQTIMGSANYMSPEQAHGNLVDSRSDVYSLGVILYRMLAGRVPHMGKSDLEVIRMAGQEPVVHPGRFRSGIPRDLETICLKCLAINPDQRYESVRDFSDDLSRFLNDEPIQARPVSFARKGLLWCRRKPWVAAVWALLMLTTIGALAFLWAFAGQRNFANQRLHEKQIAEKEARLALFNAHLQQVRLGRLGNHTGRRFDGLAAADAAAEILDELKLGAARELQLRNEVIGCLSLPDLKVDRLWKIPRTRMDTSGVAVDHELQRYATWAANGDIEIRSLTDNRLLNSISNDSIQVSGRDDWHLDLTWSSNSRYLMTRGRRSECRFRVWDLEQGGRAVLELPDQHAGSSFCFDPENQWIAVDQGAIVRYSLPGGQEISRFPGENLTGPFCCTSDGRLVFASNEEFTLVSMAGETQKSIPAPYGCPEIATASPDGSQLVYSIDNRLFMQAINGNREPDVMSVEHSSDILSIIFNSDGRFLVTSAFDGTTCIWDPKQKKRLFKTDRTAISFDRDSRYLAFGLVGNEIGRWRFVDGSERNTWQESGPINSVTFGLDGRLLVLAGDKNTSTWDTTTGKLLSRTSPGVVSDCWTAPDNSQLWLAGPAGLFRVSAKVSGDETVSVALGEPEFISAAGNSCHRLAGTIDGRFLAVSRAGDGNKLFVIDTKTGKPVSPGLNVPVAHRHSISPNAEYVSVSSWHAYECLVYRVADGKQVASIQSQSAQSEFSPDGRWLIVGDGSCYQIVDTSDWTVAWTIERDLSGGGAPIAFDRDGSVVAIGDGLRTVRLLACDSWSELATLSAHENGNLRQLALSPDGDFLVASHWNHSATLWDLRKIRNGLSGYSLDWPRPALASPNQYQTARSVSIKP